jgi:Tfp pilus assembly protein PilV
MSDQSRIAGMTLVEVLAALLVVTLGLGSYIGMLRYGQRLSDRAIGQASGIATAASVLADPEPLRSAYDPDAVRNTATTPRRDEGYLNGFYVTRAETILAADAVSAGGVVRQQLVEVEVSVYSGDSLVTTQRQRQVRNIP